MNVVVLDFETYYAKDYGLKKLSTEEYIRDDRFEVVGVAAKRNEEPTRWCTGTQAEVAEFLHSYDLGSSFVVGHNMRFDAAILSWHFDIRPLGLGDTMGMGQIIHGLTHSVSLASLSDLYGIGQKGTEVLNALDKRREDFTHAEMAEYGKYCINDVDLTYQLFHILRQKLTKQEMKLIDITIRMFTEPVLELDKPLLLDHLHKTQQTKANLLIEAGVAKEDLMSNPKFAEVLRAYGVEPPMKISQTTGKEAFAFAKTDEEFKALLEHEDPRVQILCAARLGNKSTIEETRTEQFIHIANRGLMPVPLKYAGATVSHRWSGVDGLNLQNLPRKSPLRKAIRAPKGHKIIASDLSNIELRLAYWFAGADDKVNMIREGIDLYKYTASQITGIPYDEVDDDLRFVFKVVNLSGIYGVGPTKMHSILKQGGVKKELDEVKKIVYAYRQANPELVSAWRDAGAMLDAIHAGQSYSMGKNGVITSVIGGDKLHFALPNSGMMKPNGMLLGLPNLRKLRTDNGDSWAYDKLLGRSLIPEYIHPAKTFQRCIQSLARDIIAEQLVNVARRYKVALTVHDELVIVARDEEVDECVAHVTKCMETAPEWCSDLPLNCEVGVGENYMEAK
jgi:DNA polymerase I-like protein with 3'-5' exonuclease and polymerase domains